jgi:hypothetical protein
MRVFESFDASRHNLKSVSIFARLCLFYVMENIGEKLFFSHSLPFLLFSHLRSAVPIAPDEADYYKQRTFDPDFRGGFVITSDELLYLNKINVNQFTYRICKERLYTVHNALLFQPNSFLIEAFDRVILQLQSNGLIDYWISEYIDVSYYNVKEAKKSAQKLTFHQLNGTFQMLFIGLLIASFTFIGEQIYSRFHRRKMKPIKELKVWKSNLISHFVRRRRQ